MPTLKYKKEYKYQTVSHFEIELEDCPEIPDWRFEKVGNEYLYRINNFIAIIRTEPDLGFYIYKLHLKPFYAWDGATGAIDTENFMVPSITHDAVLEAIGIDALLASIWKPWIDKFLIKLCKQFGMNWIRRQRVYWAVRLLGDPKGSQPKEIFVIKY